MWSHRLNKCGVFHSQRKGEKMQSILRRVQNVSLPTKPSPLIPYSEKIEMLGNGNLDIWSTTRRFQRPSQRPLRKKQVPSRKEKISVERMTVDHLIRAETLDPHCHFFVRPLRPVTVLDHAIKLTKMTDQKKKKTESPGVTFHTTQAPWFATSKNGQSFEPLNSSVDSLIKMNRKLRHEQAICLGITSVPEFSPSEGREDRLIGSHPRNPHHLDHSPGRWCGGAAAAITSGVGHVALTPDLSGATRVAAAWSGVVGLKFRNTLPSVRVSGLSSPLDFCHTGMITRHVQDLGVVLDLLTDSRFHFDQALPPSTFDERKFRIGVWKGDDDGMSSHPEITREFQRTIEMIAFNFPAVEWVEIPESSWWNWNQAKHHLHWWFCYQMWRQLDQIRSRGLGRHFFIDQLVHDLDTKWEKLSLQQRAARLVDLQNHQPQVARKVEAVMRDLDFLITPTVPLPPPKADCPWDLSSSFLASHRHTVPFNFSDHVSLSLPLNGVHCEDFAFKSLPTGLQIIAKKPQHLSSFDDLRDLLIFSRVLQEFVLPSDPLLDIMIYGLDE